jgi:polyhydroxyalkanoate synthesis regulator phasin
LLVEDGSLSAEESKWISDLLLAPRLRPTPPVVAAPEPGSQAEVEELRSQVEQLEKELTKLQG